MYVYYSVHVHVSYSAKCIGNFYLLIVILMLVVFYNNQQEREDSERESERINKNTHNIFYHSLYR